MKWFQGAVVLVAAAHFANMLVNSMLFSKFAFADNGWPFVVQDLLDQGLQPVTDFGYFYGLLTLVFDSAWFKLFGRSPESIIAVNAVCTLVVALGVARTMAALKLRVMPSLLMVFFTAMAVIPRGFPSPAHALDAALMMTALSEQAAGRLSRALTLVTIAVFVKPSLGYVYALILVGLILSGPNRWKRLVPAAATAATLGVFLSLWYSPEAVIRTQLPLEAMKAYSQAGYGFFFGSGQSFWNPPDNDFDTFFGGVAASFVISSVLLFLTALGLAKRWREPAAHFPITCAILNFVFVFFLFGNQFTWIYYTYILFVGTAAALNAWPRWIGGITCFGLMIVAFAGQYEWLWHRDKWTREHAGRREVTAGLYAPEKQAVEWGEIRKLAAGYTDRRTVLVLSRMGCPQMLAPELDGPHWWCLIEGYTSEVEFQRVREQIADAEWIVSPDWHDNDLTMWKELGLQQHFEVNPDPAYAHFKNFRIYRRKH